MRELGSRVRSLDLTLRAVGTPPKGFKQGSHLIGKAETLVPIKVQGPWEQSGPRGSAPVRRVLLGMVGGQGDPEDLGARVAEGEELLDPKASGAPAPRSGDSGRWELCLRQGHVRGGMSAVCFLEKAVSSLAGSLSQPRPHGRTALPALKDGAKWNGWVAFR